MSRLLIAACLAILTAPVEVGRADSRTVSEQNAATTERKFVLHFDRPGARITRDTAAALNVRTLAEYDTMIAVALPEQARDAFLEHVTTLGARAVELEDVILTPRATVSTVHKAAVPSGAGPGLFLIQSIAPATEAWQAAIRRSGVVAVGAVPERSVLVAGTLPQISELARLPWVQYAGPYEPAFKYAPVADPSHTEFTIQLADVPIASDAIGSIRHRVGALFAETRHEGILTARFTADMATAQALLEERFVIGVEAYRPMQSSDERQALSVTTAGPPSGGTTRYLAWLNAPGRDITPDKLTQSGIIVDIADTGVDNGCGGAGTRHLDLAGRTVYHNGATPIGGRTESRLVVQPEIPRQGGPRNSHCRDRWRQSDDRNQCRSAAYLRPRYGRQ